MGDLLYFKPLPRRRPPMSSLSRALLVWVVLIGGMAVVMLWYRCSRDTACPSVNGGSSCPASLIIVPRATTTTTASAGVLVTSYSPVWIETASNSSSASAVVDSSRSRLISSLTGALLRTKRVEGPEAARLATLFVSVAVPRVDAWLLAAFAWVESGFRPWAVEGDKGVRGHTGGPGLGLYQHHVRWYDPECSFDVVCASRAEVVEELRWARWHATHCRGLKPHDVLAHHFGGVRVESNESAIVSAAKVRAARRWLLHRGEM